MDEKKLSPFINGGFPLSRLKGMTAEEWFEYGLKSAKSHQSDLAMRAFDNALKLEPNFADAAYYKGIVLLGIEGRVSEALKFLHKALDLYKRQNRAEDAERTRRVIEKTKHHTRFSEEDLQFEYDIGLQLLKLQRLKRK